MPSGKAETSQALARVEMLDDVVPFDTQFGEDTKKTVPDGLRDVLFGGATSGLNTFAILDAARFPGLPEALEASGLEHSCLFQGEAFDELNEVAPRAVKLDETSDFVRALFTRDEAHWAVWDDEPGIFFRAPHPLQVLWRHLRKFTRVPTENGAIQFFRFWEPGMAVAHFNFLTERLDWYADWLPKGFQAVILQNSGAVTRYTALDTQPPRINGHFKMTEAEIARFRRVKRKASYDRVARNLKNVLTDTPGPDIRATVAAVADKFGRQGFRMLNSIYTLAYWDLVHGPGYETRDPEGILAEICASNRDEALRIRDLSDRMAQLHGPAQGEEIS